MNGWLIGGIAAAAAVGVLLPLQALINARLAQETTGALFASFISFAVGTAMLALALLTIGIELSLRAAGRYLPPGDIPAWALHVDWGMIERMARATYAWTALLAIFGWSRTLLDRPFAWLPRAREAVYPWYILHQSLIVALAFWVAPLGAGPVLEPLLVGAGTIAGCLLLHEGLVRRNRLLRPLFGLPARTLPPTPQAATATTHS